MQSPFDDSNKLTAAQMQQAPPEQFAHSQQADYQLNVTPTHSPSRSTARTTAAAAHYSPSHRAPISIEPVTVDFEGIATTDPRANPVADSAQQQPQTTATAATSNTGPKQFHYPRHQRAASMIQRGSHPPQSGQYNVVQQSPLANTMIPQESLGVPGTSPVGQQQQQPPTPSAALGATTATPPTTQQYCQQNALQEVPLFAPPPHKELAGPANTHVLNRKPVGTQPAQPFAPPTTGSTLQPAQSPTVAMSQGQQQRHRRSQSQHVSSHHRTSYSSTMDAPPQMPNASPQAQSMSRSKSQSSHATPVSKPPAPSSRGQKRRTLGDWDLGDVVGSGSMGQVKVARNKVTHAICAVKVVPRATVEGRRNQQATQDSKKESDESKDIRTVREGAIARLLNHKYICKLYEMHVKTSHYYMLFEYVSGGQMLDYIINHGYLKERLARKFCRMIVSALEYCHSNSIVHRGELYLPLVARTDTNF